MTAGANDPTPDTAVVTTPKKAPRYQYATTPKAADAHVTEVVGTLPTELAAARQFSMWMWGSLAVVALGMALLYSHEMANLWQIWGSDPGWSHGFLILPLACFFAWAKRDVLRELAPRGTWVGLGVILMAVIGQVLFRASGTVHMSYVSMAVALNGIVLWTVGWEYLKVLWMPIGYLVFCMVPPSTLYVKMTMPMQTIAAQLGVWLMPLFGGQAFRAGTTIQMRQGGTWVSLDVADACSGMRMLVAFFALAVALAYTTDRPMWQKVTLATLALPIAIFCNAMRVALTGLFGAELGMAYAKGTPHAMLGLAMLVPALGLQLLAGWVLDRMFVEVPDAAEGRAA